MTCYACGNGELSEFFNGGRVPVLCNQLWPTPTEARGAPLGEMRLGFCAACGMVGNLAFDPSLLAYDEAYENSLHFSARFQDYARRLALGLIEAHALRGKDVVEIGCGKGDFLRLLCSLGPNRGLGFDASYEGPERISVDGGEVRVVRGLYTPEMLEVEADLVVCRHVLEHLPQPVGFLEQIRGLAARREGAAVFFEVPDVLYTLRDLGIWDLIYEHCSYFSTSSLARVFERAGFSVHSLESAYAGQFLCLGARGRGKSQAPFDARPTPQEMAGLVDAFAEHHRDKVRTWNERLAGWIRAGETVAIWGAGSKGITFLNTLDDADAVRFVVDINTRKQGRHVPGTGHRVVAPEALKEGETDKVLIMNGIYRSEIESTLSLLGVQAEVEVV